ncbi:MAG TPA: zinc-dependent metalloprotease family protein, partial [Saprospiraceae bacterium]|nr:zinc-dependent metalloprotease family protein [Saprospiraceae bacterium]
MKNLMIPSRHCLSSIALVFVLTILQCFHTNQLLGQNWNIIQNADLITNTGEKDIKPNKFLIYELDDNQIKTILSSAPKEDENGNNDQTTIKLGLPDGEIEEFSIFEYKMMEDGLAAKFPEIKTYLGVSIVNPSNHVRIDYTAHGLRAMIFSPEGYIFIDHYQRNDKNHKIVYYKKDYAKTTPWFCGVTNNGLKDRNNQSNGSRIGDCGIRHDYQIAIAATGEYTTFHGGTVALAQAAIVTTMNRVNGVFETECASRMILIANNNLIIYTNAGTDPYTNGDPGLMIDQNQTNIDAVIGNANYDIGHVFGTNSGGLAGLGVVCNNSFKALGVTGSGAPIGDPFDIDYVAHEIGHQFNANHTQYNDCNRNDATSIEPGSASTIMGYAGICAPDVQANSNAYFSTASLYEIRPFVASNTCDTEITVTNSAPAVTPVSNYSIPISTPFVLTASATDPDGTLSYCWEQINTWVSPTQTMPPASTNLTGPMFRSLSPVASPSRYFPNLSDILSNTNPTWEELPSIGRTMNFRVTVRDNVATAGCTGEVESAVTTVSAAGPFLVTSPNSALSYAGNSTQIVTWDVAGTTAAPINCGNVDILLTTNGGNTFTTLVANTPNDGTQSVTMPNISSTTARVWIKCSNNIFFDVSNVNFTISAVAEPCSELFISEYVEGSSNNKAIEIYNPTMSPVVLTGNYQLRLYFNGSASVGNTINLTGTLNAQDVYVVANTAANATILAQTDLTSGSLTFNGDDAVELFKNGTSTTIDVIGQIGFDPGTEWGTSLTSTADNTIRRKSTVNLGDTNGTNIYNPTVEWDGFANDTFDGLGSYISDCQPTCPELANITPNNVTIINSTCTSPTCSPANGTITAAVNNCPMGSSIQYSTDAGMTWVSSVPTYNQSGPTQTIITRCLCDIDSNVFSPSSTPISTVPAVCPTSAVISGNGTFCFEGNTGNFSTVTIVGGTSPYSVVATDGTNQYTINNYTSGSPFSVVVYNPLTLTLVSVTDANGCTVPMGQLSGMTVVTEDCAADCPVISNITFQQNCTSTLLYDLSICFAIDIPGSSDMFMVTINGVDYGPYSYSSNGPNQGQYCVTVPNLDATNQNELNVFITDLGNEVASPIIDGNSVVDTEWDIPVASSDDIEGWAGVNVNDLYISSDESYVYFGTTFNNAADWQSWGFAINTIDGQGGTSEVWTYPIIYNHAQAPDFVIKGHFGQGGSPYAELRKWNGSTWIQTNNAGIPAGLAAVDFAANEAGMVEVRILKSILGNPTNVDVQFYVSGNNSGEHGTFDAVPNDQVADSWNECCPFNELDNYISDIVIYYPDLCQELGNYTPVACLPCPTLAPLTKTIYYCVDEMAVPLTATTQSGGTLVWYNQNPNPGPASPLPSAPTPSTNTTGNTSYWVTESVGNCEGPAAELVVSVSNISITSVDQTCTNPVSYDLEICFNAQNTPNAQEFNVTIDGTTFGPYKYVDYNQEGSFYCITIENAGATDDLDVYDIVVTDGGIATNQTPVLDGLFDSSVIWGTPVAVANNIAGWADANAQELYITQDETYIYLGAKLNAPNWQSWAFLLNTKNGGGTADSWSRAIDYAHTDKPDYIFRGTFSGYAEFHTWNGLSWSGVGSSVTNTEFAANPTNLVEVRILKSAIGDICDLDVQFYITGNNNEHGSFDAVPDDNNATSWNENNNRTQLGNYAPNKLVEQTSYVACNDILEYTEESCGTFFISDPCTCNNDATLAGNDGSFDEEITVTGPAGLTITANCLGCTPTAITFTEVMPGSYVSSPFTHIDNIGYMAEIFADGTSVGNIGNKCAYPNVAVNNIGPFTDCDGQPNVPLTAVITGDNGTGTYTWSGTGVTSSNFNPSGLIPGIIVVNLAYDGVDVGNVSPDGGITPAYPGCIQMDTIQIQITPAAIQPVVDNITVCEGESTLITVTSSASPGPEEMVSFNWIFDTEVTTGTLTGPGAMGSTISNATVGSGLGGVSFPGGNAPTAADAYSGNNWTAGTTPDPNDYFQFCLSAVSGYQIDLTNFSFDAQRSGTGPVNFQVSISVDGGAYSDVGVAGLIPTAFTTNPMFTRILNVTNANNVCIRVSGYGSTGTGGTFRIDNVSINGSSQLILLPAGSYNFYNVNPDVNMGATPVANGTMYDPMTTALGSPDTIWITCIDPLSGCESSADSVLVTVNQVPSLDITQPEAVCSPETVNVLNVELFESPIGGTVSYYTTLTDAENEQNEITTGLDNVSESTIIFVRYELGTGCFIIDQINVQINPIPLAPQVIDTIRACTGGSTLITVNTTPIQNAFTWDFESGITGQGISSDTIIAQNGPVQTTGNGLTGVNPQAVGSGCTASITSTGYDITNTSLADAVADNEFFEFCIGNTETGFDFDGVSAINWSHRISGTGPMSWAIVASNNLTSPILSGMLTGTSCQNAGGSISLNTATCYRIYYWGASNVSGTLRIANFEITGQYQNQSTYNWYNVNPDLNPNAIPVASGDSYDPGTTVGESPETIWVNCINNATGCVSPSAQTVVYAGISPTVNPVANQMLCTGFTTTAVTFAGSPQGVVFNWTNNTPSIGLAAMGTGNIAAFTAINNTSIPVVATITVTATFTSGGITCTGNPITFTITVNPLPTVFTVSGGGTKCTTDDGLAITLSGSQTGVNYQLQLNGGNIGTPVAGTGAALNFPVQSTAGTYTVVATNATTGCTNNMTGNAVILVITCGATITDPCVCLNNATSPTNGQFSEMITVNAPAGQTWTVSAVSGLFTTTSPAPPAAPIAITVGTVLTASGGTYTLNGRHIDALGYTLSVTNNRGTTLTIGNSCSYPSPIISSPPAAVCLGTPYPLTGIPGDANIISEGFTVNGVAATTFNPTATGTYTIVYTVNGGTPKAFGPNDPGCIQSITQLVEVNPLPVITLQPADTGVCDDGTAIFTVAATVAAPSTVSYQWQRQINGIWTNINGATTTTLTVSNVTDADNNSRFRVIVSSENTNGVSCPVFSNISWLYVHTSVSMTCNGHINYSLDENCGAENFANIFLSGPNSSFFYDVIFKLGNTVIPTSQVKNYIGRVLTYEVIDICDGNKCWGTVTFEDKLPPVLNCPCSAPPANVSTMTEIARTGTKIYYRSNGTYSWQAAYAHAQSIGGQMVSINNAQENALIKAGMDANYPAGWRVWIGLTDDEAYGGSEA